MITSRRSSLTLIVASATVLTLAGCSSSGGGSGSSGGSKLTKAEFITQADALCASTLAKINAGPTPTGLTDYTAIVKADELALAEEPKFITAMTKLVDRSPDAAALHKNWIDVQNSEFTQQKGLIVQLDEAAKAKDDTKINHLVQQLGSMPDHSADAAKYLKTYGLAKCSDLANNGNG